MAGTPSDRSPVGTLQESGSELESSGYWWCHQCDKRVTVETLAGLPDVVCRECKAGFVESTTAVAVQSPAGDSDDPTDDASLGNQFIQVLRLISQAARDDGAPHPFDPSDGDYLRIELDGRDNDDEDDDDEDDDGDGDDDDDDDDRSVEIAHEDEAGDREPYAGNNRSDGEDEDEIEVISRRDADDDEEMRRRRRDLLRLRLRDFVYASRGNRILDWAEILMGLDDHSIDLRLHAPDSDTYVGNPGDYVDAAGYEALLQNLAESDGAGRRGAPPASKAVVEGLESVLIGKEENAFMCVICKDVLSLGDVAKNLPCGHGYHSECIIPWLGTRNSCPVCRFELPTDDPEYEVNRKKRAAVAGLRASSSASGSSSSGVGGYNSGA